MKPRIIQVEKKELNLHDYVKREAVENDFGELIRDSCIIKEGDSIKAVYLRLPPVPLKFREAIINQKYGKARRTAGLITYSKIFGSSPREQIRKDYCSTTAFARDDPEGHAAVCKYAENLADYYQEFCPEIFEFHQGIIDEKVKSDWVIEKSPFTSGIINKNNALNYHFDRGNFSDVYSNMVALKHDVRGGYLSMPAYNIGLEIADNSVLFFDGQKILHGVTPITYLNRDAYRFTIVYYSLKAMWKCESPEMELERIKKRKTEREVKRLKRLKGEIPQEIV